MVVPGRDPHPGMTLRSLRHTTGKPHNCKARDFPVLTSRGGWWCPEGPPPRDDAQVTAAHHRKTTQQCGQGSVLHCTASPTEHKCEWAPPCYPWYTRGTHTWDSSLAAQKLPLRLTPAAHASLPSVRSCSRSRSAAQVHTEGRGGTGRGTGFRVEGLGLACPRCPASAAQGRTQAGAHPGRGTPRQGHTQAGAHPGKGTPRQGHTKAGAHPGEGKGGGGGEGGGEGGREGGREGGGRGRHMGCMSRGFSAEAGGPGIASTSWQQDLSIRQSVLTATSPCASLSWQQPRLVPACPGSKHALCQPVQAATSPCPSLSWQQPRLVPACPGSNRALCQPVLAATAPCASLPGSNLALCQPVLAMGPHP